MAHARFSDMLANRRRQLGLSIGQAAQELRLRADVLEAFESGDLDAMPKGGSAQSMLATYARYLGLDANDVVDQFCEELDVRQRRGRDGVDETGAYGYGGRYPQGRPYTGHAPYEARERERRQASARRNALRRGERSYERSTGYERGRRVRESDNISTLPVGNGGYEDDLGFGNDAQPYRAASTAEGRPSRGSVAPAGRPNVRRQEQRPRAQRRVRPSSSSRGRKNGSGGRVSSFFDDPVHAVVTVVILVVVILTVVIILSVSSCVSTAMGENSKSVPVSSTQSTTQDESSDTTSSDEEDEARQQLAAVDANSNDTSDVETDVTVSVADGAVTWLEVVNDGTSDVADTVTGPWERTYMVTDSITIQAGDTSSVTVTRNGKQVQFDSLASGVGTVTIKGTAPASTDTASSDADATEADGSATGTQQGSSGSSTSASSTTGTSGSSTSSGSSSTAGSGSDSTAGASSSGSDTSSAGSGSGTAAGASAGTASPSTSRRSTSG